jgi:hypothetical protein
LIKDLHKIPEARQASISWIDSAGNLWFFGGDAYDSAGSFGELNDLWEYTPSNNRWTWISGADTADQEGVYGTEGLASAMLRNHWVRLLLGRLLDGLHADILAVARSSLVSVFLLLPRSSGFIASALPREEGCRGRLIISMGPTGHSEREVPGVTDVGDRQ